MRSNTSTLDDDEDDDDDASKTNDATAWNHDNSWIRIYKTILQLLSNNILLFVNDTGKDWGRKIAVVCNCFPFKSVQISWKEDGRFIDALKNKIHIK